MQRGLIGLTPLAGTLSDSDFFDLTLLAGTLSGIVGILSFEHSVRLQRSGQNASGDRTLQGCEWLVDRLIHESGQSLHRGSLIAA